ncbi:MAG: hypothetical protein OSB38_40570 [Paraburkholderia fungorum]|nr:hypothetical protein [Paraburkholderia fungorum]
MSNTSTAPADRKLLPGRTKDQLSYLSAVAEGHGAYLQTIFQAIKATAETAPKLAVDLAALGEYVAEMMGSEIDSVGITINREVH